MLEYKTETFDIVELCQLSRKLLSIAQSECCATVACALRAGLVLVLLAVGVNLIVSTSQLGA
jgi:hypothetical protein